MGTQPVFKLLVSMAVPAMFSMLIQALYNIVDSIFVAMVSQEALAAVSLVFPVQNLLIAVAVGTGVGINSLVSRSLGAKDQKLADSAATHGIFLGICNWAIFALLAVLVAKPFFHMFTGSENMINLAIQYAQIVMMCSFGSFIQINIEKTLQATGNMMDPMRMMLVGALTNLVLDPIMIFGLLGFPKMGVAGAAIATVIGQIVAMFYAIWVVFTKRRNHEVNISLRGFRPDGRAIREIYKVGVPSIIMQSIGAVCTTGLNMILSQFSQASVAVLGIYYKLQSFVYMPVFGLTHGMMPIVGYSYGAKNQKRLRETLKIAFIIAVAIMAVGMVIFMVFARQLLVMFSADAEIFSVGIPALRIACLGFIPASISIVMSSLFQSIGLGTRSMLISILRQLVIILPVAWLLSQIGVSYVWWALCIADVSAALLSILFYRGVSKKYLRPLGNK